MDTWTTSDLIATLNQGFGHNPLSGDFEVGKVGPTVVSNPAIEGSRRPSDGGFNRLLSRSRFYCVSAFNIHRFGWFEYSDDNVFYFSVFGAGLSHKSHTT